MYLEPTPSIDEFKLPPTTYIGKPNEFNNNQQKIVSWTWVDSTWSKYQDEQYGNWNWKFYNNISQSSGNRGYTRRQKWCRYAQRKESWIDVFDNSSTTSSSSIMIGGSQTSNNTSDYNYCWDSNSSTASTSSSSSVMSSSSIATKPILISNVHRRSSSQSVSTFNTPILSHQHIEEDDEMLYKQFCTSPIPQRKQIIK
jgi:hypothetical protein